MYKSNENRKFSKLNRFHEWSLSRPPFQAMHDWQPSHFRPSLTGLGLPTFKRSRDECSNVHQLGSRTWKKKVITFSCLSQRNGKADLGEAKCLLLFSSTKSGRPCTAGNRTTSSESARSEKGWVECRLNTNKTHLFAVPADAKGPPLGLLGRLAKAPDNVVEDATMRWGVCKDKAAYSSEVADFTTSMVRPVPTPYVSPRWANLKRQWSPTHLGWPVSCTTRCAYWQFHRFQDFVFVVRSDTAVVTRL